MTQGKKANLPMDIIIPRYKNGESGREISEDFDVCPKTIINWLELYGIKRRYKDIKIINPQPTREFAYLFGLVLGDGWLDFGKKTHNYSIVMESSSKRQIKNFKNAIMICFPNLSVWESSRRKKRKFIHNNKIYEYDDKTYIVGTSSQLLYNLILPFKKKDFFWDIPLWIESNKNTIYGFLDGLIEAEGSFHKDTKYKLGISRIHIISKHKSNLEKVDKLLKKMSIGTTILKRKNSFVLNINKKKDMQKIIDNCPKCLGKVNVKNNRVEKVKP